MKTNLSFGHGRFKKLIGGSRKMAALAMACLGISSPRYTGMLIESLGGVTFRKNTLGWFFVLFLEHQATTKMEQTKSTFEDIEEMYQEYVGCCEKNDLETLLTNNQGKHMDDYDFLVPGFRPSGPFLERVLLTYNMGNRRDRTMERRKKKTFVYEQIDPVRQINMLYNRVEYFFHDLWKMHLEKENFWEYLDFDKEDKCRHHETDNVDVRNDHILRVKGIEEERISIICRYVKFHTDTNGNTRCTLSTGGGVACSVKEGEYECAEKIYNNWKNNPTKGRNFINWVRELRLNKKGEEWKQCLIEDELLDRFHWENAFCQKNKKRKTSNVDVLDAYRNPNQHNQKRKQKRQKQHHQRDRGNHNQSDQTRRRNKNTISRSHKVHISLRNGVHEKEFNGDDDSSSSKEDGSHQIVFEHVDNTEDSVGVGLVSPRVGPPTNAQLLLNPSQNFMVVDVNAADHATAEAVADAYEYNDGLFTCFVDRFVELTMR